MLNLKKVIALVCVFALALTTVAFGATYSDVAEDSAYYEAVETLNKLEIITGYEDGTFKPEDGVTRAEMAALIARIQGYGETAKGSANTGFTDVPASHWASGYIANAAGMGIINGYGDGTFGPEDQVLYEQAVKMVMATLGYTPFAEKNGGYPTGYLAAAQRYDVSLAVANAVQGAPANRGTIAQILENAIDTPLMIQSQWNTNGEVTYIIADGSTNTWGQKVGYKTLMSENLGYVKVRGVVNETPITEIDSTTKTINTEEEEKVTINVVDCYDTENKLYLDGSNGLGNKEFLVNGTDAADYLGRSVIAYIKANAKDNFELLSIAVDTNRNEELTIGVQQFVGHDTTEKKVSYLKEGASQPTKITMDPNGFDVVYNFDGGIMSSVTNLSTFLDKTATPNPLLYGGTLTFIDNDDENGYNVVVIELAATAVVEEVEDNYVAFKDAATLATGQDIDGLLIDEDDETKIVQVQKDGEVIDIAELQEWDVLSIIAAKNDADVIVAEVVTNQVVGTIASTKKSKTSADNTGYSIDGTWYDVAATTSGDALKIGLGGTFYIDKYGKIAAFNEDSALAGGAVANYAYILGVAIDDQTTFGSAVVKVQMLTDDGVVVMEVKNNAKLDGTTIYTTDGANNTTAADAATALGATVSNGVAAFNVANGYIVKYTKNSAGALSTIVKASANGDFSDLNNSGSGKFDAENFKFEGVGYVDADAKVFAIAADPKESVILSAADFEDENLYTVKAMYATDDADDCDMVVVDAAAFKAAGATSNVAVITGVSETSNDEGEEVLGVSYYVNGEEFTALTDADTAAGLYTVVNGSRVLKLTIGDIAKIKVTGDVITSVKFVANFVEDIKSGNTVAVAAAGDYTAAAGEKFAMGTATAFKKTSDQITLADADSTGSLFSAGTFKLLSSANKYVIDITAAGDITIGTTGSYKYFKNIYEDAADSDTFTVKKNGDILNATANAATAKGLTDYVVVRTYEDKVTDIIIIRGADTIQKNAPAPQGGGQQGI